MTWYYNDEPFEPGEEDVGFVYRITRLDTGRAYIGKKNLWKTVTRPPLKGKKRKRRSVAESDWREYWGSNKTLQGEVADLGQDRFRRDVMRVCQSKAEMSYYEAKFQLVFDVLLRDDYYNDFVGCKIHRAHLKKLQTG
jgi:hypothetical protein